MLGNFAVPAAAVWILLTKAWDISDEATWVRIIATVTGFLLLVIALSALNVVLFSQASLGTWRQRMPGIFIDIARLVLIAAGLAVLFSWVWGANVGGLFAALGVTSIVLGFALQNAIGSIISGLLLLFEQPFHLGDWLDTGSVRGRVVEVNWRAVHLDTGNGIQIIPNATLAGSSFTNLSEPAGVHVVAMSTTFGPNDPPEAVRRLLDGLAQDLAQLHPDAVAHTDMTAPATYQTVITVRSPSDAGPMSATFHRWAWYAARRGGLHLDGATDPYGGAEETEAAVRSIASTLRLQPDEIGPLATAMRLERWGAGEIVQRADTIPDGLRFVLQGHVRLHVITPTGLAPVAVLDSGDYLGQSCLVREAVVSTGVALDEVVTLLSPQATIDDLVRNRTALATELGAAIELRRAQARSALTGELSATTTGAHSAGR